LQFGDVDELQLLLMWCVWKLVYFGDVVESVFDTGDVFGNSIFTCDMFESRLQSDFINNWFAVW
jgi:hypothetical protein